MRIATALPLILPLLIAAPAHAAFDCEEAADTLEFFEWADASRDELGSDWSEFFRWKKSVQKKTEKRYATRCVRLNEVQVIGTHNSYHVQPTPDVFEALLRVSSDFLAWEYTHRPLRKQFAKQGIRQIELDVYADSEGGLYSSRAGMLVLMRDPASGIAKLDEPGFKVLHVQDLDFETRCYTFIDCLKDVKRWSDANPKHLPIMIMVEAKDDEIPDPLLLGFVVPELIGAAEFRALDAEILSVFPRDQIITPDDVRNGAETLEDAVLAGGWPTLKQARGRVLFSLDNAGDKRTAYMDGNLSLEDRLLFTNSLPGEPDAAFVKVNDPLGDEELIPDLVESGYIVRTRADGDTDQARSGDTTQRDAAIASGAQYVSTDYPVENPDFGTGYAVELPDRPALEAGRCNPLNAPRGCRSGALE
jgi:hypothetical protein